jgi:phage FluMu protein Com
MKIYTLSCSDCGTVVAANELEANRVQKCPGLDCKSVLRFEDLSEEAQEHIQSHAEKYDI